MKPENEKQISILILVFIRLIHFGLFYDREGTKRIQFAHIQLTAQIT